MSWNILTEESRRIEKEVMAEIMTALNLDNDQGSKTPTAVVSVPELKASPQESTASLLTDSSSVEDDAGLALANTKKDSQSSRSIDSLDESAFNDSFVDRMNFSTCSSIGGSSDGTYDSQKYYIGKVKEDDEICSVQTHVSQFGAEEMNHMELIEVVQTLYRELKNADRSLAHERKRRHSREKSLIKLAKELKKRKDLAAKHLQRIQEMQQEITAVQSEKSFIEERLQEEKQKNNEICEISRRDFEKELYEKVQMYEAIIAQHDHRILEINQRHANQCEHLCREVVEANQEVMRLQKKLSEVSRSHSAEGDSPSGAILSPCPLKARRRSGIMSVLGVSLLFWSAAMLGDHFCELHNPVIGLSNASRTKGIDASRQFKSDLMSGDYLEIIENEEAGEEHVSIAVRQDTRTASSFRPQIIPSERHVRGALDDAAQPFKWFWSIIMGAMRPWQVFAVRKGSATPEMKGKAKAKDLYDLDVRFFE